jgi:hypothetical protein
MAFGALFRTEEDIVELIRGTYDALRDVLAKMEGKVEFGLKVNWDRVTSLTSHIEKLLNNTLLTTFIPEK